MKDVLGNTLAAGQLVLWNNMLAKVTSVVSSPIALDKKVSEEAVLTLEVKLVNPPQGAVVRVVDPASEAAVEKAMGA
jgi:hypothetical protein